MKTLFHTVGALLLACGLWLSMSVPALAGYGNHAERATVNIQTRVALGKANLLNTVAPIQANAQQALAKTRTP
jgi:hypothetical protein